MKNYTSRTMAKLMLFLLILHGCGSNDRNSSPASAGPTGPTGTAGPSGPQGPAGAAGEAGESFQQATRKLLELLKPLRAGAVNLICGSASGSGTRISSDTVVTAFHVIDGASSCVIRSNGLQVAVGGNLSRSVSGRDIGYVRNLNFSSDIPIVPMKKDSEISVGDLIVLLSYPSNLTNDLQTSIGFVTDDDAQTSLGSMGLEWKNAIMTDMSAGSGSSGGPIFNDKGEFIGIHVGGFGSNSSGLELNFQLTFKSGD